MNKNQENGFVRLNNRTWWTISVAILVLATFIRMRHIDTTGIWSDQSFTLNTAMRWINGGDFPLASNKSSVGFVNPPMIEYFNALGLVFWGDILSVAYVTMLSGLAAIMLTGWAANKIFGRLVAIWAMAFFAFNPWSVEYSQLIWNQTAIPFFATLTFTTLLLYICWQQRPWLLLVSCIAAGCMTQVHPASAPQIFAIGLILLIYIGRVHIWAAICGGVLFIITYIPYIIYEMGVGWVDLQAIRQISEQESVLSNASFLVSIDLLHAQGIPHTLSRVVAIDQLTSVLFATTAIATLWVGRSWLNATFPQFSKEVNPQRDAILVILLWFAVPILFYLRSQEHLQIYYLINQFPTHFLILGIGMGTIQSFFFNKFGRLAGLAAAFPILLLLGWQAYFSLNAQDVRVANAGGELQIRHVREGIQKADAAAVKHGNCTVVVLSDGSTVETSTLSLFREFSQVDGILLADADESLPLPLPCAIYIDTKPNSRASNWLTSAGAGELGTIDLQKSKWTVRKLDTSEAIDQLPQGLEKHAWVNGATLVSYQKSELLAGASLDLNLIWQVTAPPDGDVYHVGTYLLTSESQVFMQADDSGFDSVQWREGDFYITWFSMPPQAEIEAGEYELAVAFYTWPDIVRTALTTGDTTAYLEKINVTD